MKKARSSRLGGFDLWDFEASKSKTFIFMLVLVLLLMLLLMLLLVIVLLLALVSLLAPLLDIARANDRLLC